MGVVPRGRRSRRRGSILRGPAGAAQLAEIEAKVEAALAAYRGVLPEKLITWVRERAVAELLAERVEPGDG